MRVLAIASSIGGTGKTTTSIAIASAFQQLGQRTALIDFDVGLGNMERMIGSAHLGPDLLDAISSTGALALAPEAYTDKLLVIPSSRMSGTRELTPRQIQHLFERCEAFGLDYIVCDLPPGFVPCVAGLADDIIITSPVDTPLTYTVSPLLHRLRAGQPRSGKACRLHLLITRFTPQPDTPNTLPRDLHLQGQEPLTQLGVIPEVEVTRHDSESAGEAAPLLDEGVLTAYADVAAHLLHMHNDYHDKED